MKSLKDIIKLGVFILFVVIMASCTKNTDPYAQYTPEREASMIKDWKASVKKNKKMHLDSTSTGIYFIRDTTKVGTGPTVKAGNTVKVKYTGLFLDGSVFDDSSYHGDGTMTYVHMTDRMIQGWEEGIVVLSKGGGAGFLVPSAKGYGTTGSGSIPPNTPLIFIIEVLDIK
jgi:FKBP-type peptidyl-prolyl cis-trans isomerase